MRLVGVTASQLTSADKTNIKQVLADALGNICGTTGVQACQAADIITLSVTRRSASVAYSVNVATQAAANQGAANINSANTATLADAMRQKGGNLASVAGVTGVTAATQGAATSSIGDNHTGSSTTTASMPMWTRTVVCAVLALCLALRIAH